MNIDHYIRLFDIAITSDNPMIKEELSKFITVVTLNQPVGGNVGPLATMRYELKRLKDEADNLRLQTRMLQQYGGIK